MLNDSKADVFRAMRASSMDGVNASRLRCNVASVEKRPPGRPRLYSPQTPCALCARQAFALGWCERHYRREYRKRTKPWCPLKRHRWNSRGRCVGCRKIKEDK